MSIQEDFQKAMHDIYKYSPLIGLEGQEVLQSWVRRLAAAGTGNGQDLQCALDYARYLAYQLERAQMRFPFSQPPAEGALALPDLKELLFGSAIPDSLNFSRNISCFNKSRRDRAPNYKDCSLNTGAALARDLGNSTWDSHIHRWPASDWESHVADPKCERDVIANLEELADDANLWLLLTHLSSHTRDGGALLNAVLAEELAEWSARLAAEQTAAMASATATGADRGEDDDDDEDWTEKADRRADYWHEVSEARKAVGSTDTKAAQQFIADTETWLNEQNRQLQAEQAQLQALTEELQGAQRQLAQSKKWRDSQFEKQNRILQNEVTALKQSITDNAKKVEELKVTLRESSINEETFPGTKKRLSFSEDSLNTFSR